MDQTAYTELKAILLKAAYTLSPDGVAQRGFTQIVHSMEDAREEPDRVLLALIHAMGDGIAYENWPGVKP